MSKIQIINANKTGNDYICSDIHGHFDLLEQHLSNVNFNPNKDRLFCLGDLIDRSDESPQVLNYLSKPWFHSILGNHESMLIGVYENGSSNPSIRQQWYSWGGSWAEDLSDDELDVYYRAFLKFPVGIELHLKSGLKVGLIHANLPDKADWHTVINTLQEIPDDEISSHMHLLHEMLWQKASIFENYSIEMDEVKNIDHVFHGHTIVDSIIVMENRTFMDLGSYNNNKIGFVQPDQYLQQLS